MGIVSITFKENFCCLVCKSLKDRIFDEHQTLQLIKDIEYIKVMTVLDNMHKFSDILGNYRMQEQGELFHQDLKVMNVRYQRLYGHHDDRLLLVLKKKIIEKILIKGNLQKYNICMFSTFFYLLTSMYSNFSKKKTDIVNSYVHICICMNCEHKHVCICSKIDLISIYNLYLKGL